MAYNNVTYKRTGVNFTYISPVGDIIKNGKCVVKANINLFHVNDLECMYLLRAVLREGEKADLSSRSVTDKFRVIASYERGNTGNTLTIKNNKFSFEDVFRWDDNSDNNLHNLNVTNDLAWDEQKFKDSLFRLSSGEQGILYKVYGYSRRMNRGATPIGFFCDDKNIVALSQRNQVICDRWYNEGGEVWKNGSHLLEEDEHFVRVAVDMKQDLGEKGRKSRRVWASTSKGKVVLFDYWTGVVIWSSTISNDRPIFAMAFEPINEYCVVYDGARKICLLYENPMTGDVSIVKREGPLSDFIDSRDFAMRVMGAVCTVERDVDGNVTGSYFYVISNRETVIKYKIGDRTVTKVQVIPRTHFGCTVEKKDNSVTRIGNTPSNQDNVYGIGTGINGHVWANGHTPLSLESSNVKDSGNPIELVLRMGNGAKTYNSSGAVVDRQGIDSHGAGCAYVLERDIDSSMGGHKKLRNYLINNRGSYHADFSVKDLMSKLNISTLESLGRKHYGDDSYDKLWEDDENDYWHIMDRTWRFSGKLKTTDNRSKSEFKRDAKMWHYSGGCSLYLNCSEVITYIREYLNKYNHHGQLIDQRDAGRGTLITSESLKDYGPFRSGKGNSGEEEYPSNKPEMIHRIHFEIVSVRDGDLYRVNKDILQDLNFVYGCASGTSANDANYSDSNGQIEDLENPLASHAASAEGFYKDYRYKLRPSAGSPSGKAESDSYSYFSPMTKWIESTVPSNMSSGDYQYKVYGFAGVPVFLRNSSYNYDTNTFDRRVGKPTNFDCRLFDSVNANKIEKMRPMFIDKIYNSNNYVDISNYDDSPGWSIGSIYSRLPSDGRMFISKDASKTYRVGTETNAIEYEISFADRREGKIGLLKFSREANSNPSTFDPKNKRVTYTNVSASKIGRQLDVDREYVVAETTNKGYQNWFSTAPYHVVVDSDNNIWYSSEKWIGKIQMLDDKSEKYIYRRDDRSGVYQYENNNIREGSTLVLLQKHAKDGAYLSSTFYPSGIKNRDTVSVSNAYNESINLVESKKAFELEMDSDSNHAYVYNSIPWSSAEHAPDGKWINGNVFNSGATIDKKIYAKNYFRNNNNNDDRYRYKGNVVNEYNCDNFGLNSLIQLNRVEVGPDIIHPAPLRPDATSKILTAVSKSHNDRCDTFDGNSFWDAYTEIFNDEQTASGFDDLETVHYIYNIEPNYRHLERHRYVWHDKTAYGSDANGFITTSKDFEYYNNELINLLDVTGGIPNLVWKTPNYIGMVPPYPPLTEVPSYPSYEDPKPTDVTNNFYYVDLFIDYTPSVYNLVSNMEYEYIHVGRHDIHVFERWPTNKFCLKGIGDSESTDKITDYDLVGIGYWGDCK